MNLRSEQQFIPEIESLGGCMKCFKCDKEISEDEYVVNWTACNDCLSEMYEEAMKQSTEVNLDGLDDLKVKKDEPRKSNKTN